MDDGEWTFSRAGRNVSAKFPAMCLSAETVSDVKVAGIRTHDCNLSPKHRKTDAAGRLTPQLPPTTFLEIQSIAHQCEADLQPRLSFAGNGVCFWQIDLSQYDLRCGSFLSDTTSHYSTSYNLFLKYLRECFCEVDVNITKLITVKFLTLGTLRPFLECDFLKYDS